MTSNTSIVVHGPQACGKTRNAKRIAAHFGLKKVVDDWEGRSAIPQSGALVLTNVDPQAIKSAGARVLSFDQAMKLVGPRNH